MIFISMYRRHKQTGEGSGERDILPVRRRVCSEAVLLAICFGCVAADGATDHATGSAQSTDEIDRDRPNYADCKDSGGVHPKGHPDVCLYRWQSIEVCKAGRRECSGKKAFCGDDATLRAYVLDPEAEGTLKVGDKSISRCLTYELTREDFGRLFDETDRCKMGRYVSGDEKYWVASKEHEAFGCYTR
jgi:hypothetical protein